MDAKEDFMKLSNKTANIILAIIIVLSLCVSTYFEFTKQGYHEDELLTYNLANSSKQLNTDGWNSPEDFNEYLAVSDAHRFDYAQVYQNQIIDASHPPFYYALVHTVCSFFPNVFNKWLAYSVNVIMMTISLILLFKIGKRVTNNNLYALIATGGYAFSIACITTTIYLRMYSTLTMFVLAFLYITLRIFDRGRDVKFYEFLPVLPIVIFGILTQYYFILCAGLIGLVFLILQLKRRAVKSVLLYIVTALIGAGIALLIYPYIIENVLGGNRGLGSLDLSIDTVTIVTYFVYKLGTYIQILAKDLFLGQVWLLAACTVIAVGFGIFFRFVKKRKLPPKSLFVVIPGLVYFFAISMLSPFNSDRYVMASLPLISMMFVFAFIRIFGIFGNEKVRLAVPAAVLLASALGFVFVTPYYLYGKTNLYEPKTKNCVFVGTAMLEWNKCIDKFMLYDDTMIVQTTDMSPTLASELEAFAEKRGVVTNGKITAFADAYMNTGNFEGTDADSLSRLSTDSELNSLEEVTVYISRLADRDKVIDYITKNTPLRNHELIQEDCSFEDFYNWYDYFVETESYCNVYRFYR